jgi:hypothetical protein
MASFGGPHPTIEHIVTGGSDGPKVYRIFRETREIGDDARFTPTSMPARAQRALQLRRQRDACGGSLAHG